MKRYLLAGISRVALAAATPKRDLERDKALTAAARKMAAKIRPKLRRQANGT